MRPERGAMKILHAIFGEQFYGSERHCIESATAQGQRGHEVTILIRGGDSACAQRFDRMIRAARLDGPRGPGTVRLVVMPRWVPAALHRPVVRAMLQTSRPDIVHTHLNTATRRVGAAAQRIGIPHVATLHIRYDEREYGRCDGLICGASWQNTAIPADFPGLVTTIWAWLPVGVHDALARVGAADVDAVRRQWRADERTVVFGSVGRLVPEKGMDLLIEAFRSSFPAGDEPARLVIIGDGPEAAALRRAAADDARITLLGVQTEIAKLYRAFDVYVSAARFEPYGLTILEAMDANCPLIVTRTDGPREFLTDRRVLWAEPNDAAALARQLRVAAGRGRERLSYDLTAFMPEAATSAIETFYRRVIDRGAPAAP